MNLWVDDERVAPEGWVWAKTCGAALWLLSLGNVKKISLDHDLGGNDTTRPIVLWMCENDVWPDEIYVHTQNPVGREWLEGMIERYSK